MKSLRENGRGLARGWRSGGVATLALLYAAAASLLLPSCERPLAPDAGPTAADSLAIFQQAFDDPRECAPCHPNHYEEWRTSMHAYAFTDPIFFRLNDIGQARSNQQLGQFCIKCHSPMAVLLGEAEPGFDRSLVSEVAQQGIHCDICHTIDTARLDRDQRGNGIQGFRLDKVKQGPIEAPWGNNFHRSEFKRAYNRSQICAPCHDVKNPQGIQVEFTSTEWEQSPYTAMGLECQGCHMPVYTGKAAVDGPERLVHRHTFVGVDVPLVEFPGRENTIQLVDELLKNSVTMKVTAPDQANREAPLQLSVEIINDKTGHDIPSGTTFERQMWLEVIVRDAQTNAIVYSSGALDDNGDLLDHHSEQVKSGELEPDADLALFHGVALKNGQETLFFWEADEIDNRTIPAFSSETIVYETALDEVQGAAAIVTVRLRFRSFAPYFLRAIEQEQFIAEIPIFDMEAFEQRVTITE